MKRVLHYKIKMLGISYVNLKMYSAKIYINLKFLI